jgi:hypothetical protein
MDLCGLIQDLFSLWSVFVVLFYCRDPFLVAHALEHLTFHVYDWVQFYLVYLFGVHKSESLFVVTYVH